MIYIDNYISLKELKACILDINYNLIRTINLDIKKDKIEIDYNNDCYLYFMFDDKKSEIVRLSKNIFRLVLKYNEKTKSNDIYLDVNNYKYKEVKVLTLKDEKNLFFREDKEKIINILLPKDYDENKKYGVIIMFDSQNIYDLNKVGNYTFKNDPYGGWQVDVSLSSISELTNNEYIVVGIEDADYYREIELTPSKKKFEFSKLLYDLKEEKLLLGELDYFGDFINETVLPYISSNYSVNLDELGIVGSSCGGLASFYLGLRDYKQYKFIFTFTPATGFIKKESLVEFYRSIDFIKNKEHLPYIFYYQGKKGMLEELLYNLNKELIDTLYLEGYQKELIDSYIEESAEHNETMWRYGFNYAIMKYIEKRGK